MENNGKKRNAKNIVAGILAILGAIGSGILWLGIVLTEGFLALLVIMVVSLTQGEISEDSTPLPFEFDSNFFTIYINFLLPVFAAVFILLATASFACLSRREQVKKTGVILSVVGSVLLLGSIVGCIAVHMIYDMDWVSSGIYFCIAYFGLKVFCVVTDWKKTFGNKDKRLI